MDDLEVRRGNVNDYIWVKLTDAGRQHYIEYFRSLRMEPRPLEEDEEGYVRFQIWDLMHTLGQYMVMGTHLPFETNIKIQVKVEEQL